MKVTSKNGTLAEPRPNLERLRELVASQFSRAAQVVDVTAVPANGIVTAFSVDYPIAAPAALSEVRRERFTRMISEAMGGDWDIEWHLDRDRVDCHRLQQ